MKLKIEEEHSLKIQALVESGNFTYQDICNAFDNIFTIHQIKYHINKYYPDLKANIKKEYSRGGSKLESLLKQIFPYDKIKSEFPLGNRLRVDFLIDSPYNLAFEFDGSQHHTYSSHFHKDKMGFNSSQERDKTKEFILRKRGINLIRLDSLDIDLENLSLLIESVGYGTGHIDSLYLTKKERYQLQQKKYKKQQQEVLRQKAKKLRKKVKNTLQNSSNDSYQKKIKEKQKQYRKEEYKRKKEWLKKNK